MWHEGVCGRDAHLPEGFIIERVAPELGVVHVVQADIGVLGHLGEDL